MNCIVVIEDDPAILRGLAENLRAESYEVLTAMDSETGYRLVSEYQPDLVILDLMLPRLDSHGVCRRMCRNGVAIPILMLTAQPQETNHSHDMESCACEYLAKPFSVRDLLVRVWAILSRSEERPDRIRPDVLEEAAPIQPRLLPTKAIHTSGLRICGTSRPALIVGGDYFDVLTFRDGSVGVCIADVSGKGLPAALMMATLKVMVKAFAAPDLGPRDLCSKLNAALCDSIPSSSFVSLFYAVIAPDRKRLTYCNAGHNPPILISDGPTRRLHHGGGILGVFPEWNYEDRQIDLRPKDRILLYTDGVTDCRNFADEFFSEEQLIKFVDRFEDADSVGLLPTVIEMVTRFSDGNFDDDLTLVTVSIE